MSEKLVYVPRNWKVTVGGTDVALNANSEYRIIENGVPYVCTIGGIKTEEDKTYIIPKVMLFAGFMDVMEKAVDRRFDVDNITEITRMTTNYLKASRSVRDRNDTDDIFNFAFDSEKYYPSKYKISIYAGEFVAFATRDEETGRIRSIYGTILDVDALAGKIKVMRYVCVKGVRNVYEYTIDLNSLTGIYRYELEISEYTEEAAEETKVETAESATEGTVE